MNFRILKNSIELVPENQAETMQLDYVEKELRERKCRIKVMRHWFIRSMLIFVDQREIVEEE